MLTIYQDNPYPMRIYEVHCNVIPISNMNAIILFTLLIATSQANHLRQDATLFREPPQEAKVERFVEKANECTICQNVIAVMQNSVTQDGSIYQYSKLEEFKTMARHACHGYHIKKEEKECLEIVEDTQQIMDHLYDKHPSTCEVLGHCKRCRPCPAPAECMICEPPTASEVSIWEVMHTGYDALRNFFTTAHPADYTFDEDI